jgi:hypothetical protein
MEGGEKGEKKNGGERARAGQAVAWPAWPCSPCTRIGRNRRGASFSSASGARDGRKKRKGRLALTGGERRSPAELLRAVAGRGRSRGTSSGVLFLPSCSSRRSWLAAALGPARFAVAAGGSGHGKGVH